MVRIVNRDLDQHGFGPSKVLPDSVTALGVLFSRSRINVPVCYIRKRIVPIPAPNISQGMVGSFTP